MKKIGIEAAIMAAAIRLKGVTNDLAYSDMLMPKKSLSNSFALNPIDRFCDWAI